MFSLALLSLAAVSNCDDPPKEPYDFFKLALQWPYSYCKDPKHNCRRTIPKQFTIHGLWPQKTKGKGKEKVEYCKTTELITKDMLKGMKEDMMGYWPDLTTNSFEKSVETWSYQWRKHGSCSSENLKPIPYFQKALALVKANNLRSMLKKKGIEPHGQTYTVNSIVNAVKAATSHYPDVICIVEVKGKRSTSYLEEIHLCFDDKAEVIRDCPYNPNFPTCMENPGSKVRQAKFSSQDDAFGSINITAAATAAP
ncbi:Ribonuclease [Quillaja saponaria]|uniref:Ribonuclease n=1 Tax=Quillaja saponaria TaxID=32244 RepID=A0AAD7Q4M0_QUISA|nr:Ribonuclease [Quillaja saponaria]